MNYDDAVTYIWQGHRPDRLSRFLEVYDKSWSNDQIWRLIREIYEDTKSAGVNYRIWEILWGSERPGREHAMTEDEHASFMALPDEITIYRGISDGLGRGCRRHVRGFSWTVSRDGALWFAERFTFAPAIGWLGTVTIPKRKVRAYLDGRDEAEVIVVRRDLPRVRIETIAGREGGSAG